MPWWVVRYLKNIFLRCKKALRNKIQNGVLAGYPLLGVKATLYDGSFHDVDSNEMAFKIAAVLPLASLLSWVVRCF